MRRGAKFVGLTNSSISLRSSRWSLEFVAPTAPLQRYSKWSRLPRWSKMHLYVLALSPSPSFIELTLRHFFSQTVITALVDLLALVSTVLSTMTWAWPFRNHSPSLADSLPPLTATPRSSYSSPDSPPSPFLRSRRSATTTATTTSATLSNLSTPTTLKSSLLIPSTLKYIDQTTAFWLSLSHVI